MLQHLSSLQCLVLVSLGHLSEEVDWSDHSTAKVLLDYLVYSVPGVVYKDYYVHDLLEYLNRSTLRVDLVEDIE